MGNAKLMKLIYLKPALKPNSFDSIGTKIPFFGVLVTIEQGRSLLTVRHHELFDMSSFDWEPAYS